MGEFPVTENIKGSYPYDVQLRNFSGGGFGGAPQGGDFFGGGFGGAQQGGGIFGGGAGGFPQGGGFFGDEPMYPGLGGNPYSQQIRPGGGLPATTSSSSGAAGGAGGLLGGFNFNQIKTFVERMGGIDGIIGTMSKVQKMVTSFQQMAPMLKLMFGAFGPKAATKNTGVGRSPAARRRRSSSSSSTSSSSRKGPGKGRYNGGKRPVGVRSRR